MTGLLRRIGPAIVQPLKMNGANLSGLKRSWLRCVVSVRGLAAQCGQHMSTNNLKQAANGCMTSPGVRQMMRTVLTSRESRIYRCLVPGWGSMMNFP